MTMRCIRVLGLAFLLGLPACKAADLSSDAAGGPDGTVASDSGAAADAGAPPVLSGCTPINESERRHKRSSSARWRTGMR